MADPPSCKRGTPSASKEMYHPQYTTATRRPQFIRAAIVSSSTTRRPKTKNSSQDYHRRRASRRSHWRRRASGLCVAERGLETAQIGVYDVVHRKKKRVVQYQDIQTDTIVHMAFSHDGKYLLTQGSGPEWTLVLWAFDKKTVKPVGSTRT